MLLLRASRACVRSYKGMRAGRVGDSLGAVDRGPVFLPSLPTAVQGIALLMPRSAAAGQRDVLEGTHAGQVGLVHSTGPPCSGPTDFQKQATGSPASLRLRAQSETARAVSFRLECYWPLACSK